MRIKICGITNREDAWTALDAGADALGFVFYAKSPRAVTPAVARTIIRDLPPFVVTVGVFVNEDPAIVRDAMDQCGLALAQLHGDETPAYCESLGRPVVKAIRVKDRGAFLALAEYQGRAGVRGFLLDAFSEEAYGGTGRLSDWQLAAEAAKTASIVLAGGLTVENVADAVKAVRPYGIDVSSGVESAPGRKDASKVAAFIRAARL